MKREASVLIAGAMLLLLALPQPILADNQANVLQHFVTVPTPGLSSEGIAIRGNAFYVSTIGFASVNGSVFAYDKKGDLIQTINLPGLPIVGQGAFFGNSLFVVACAPFTTGGGDVVKIDLKTGVANTTFAADPTGCLNGLTIDDQGTIYAANFGGWIDKVTQGGAITLQWASGGLITAGSLNGFVVGPNDLTYNDDQNAIYTTNTYSNTVVKIQINNDGSAGAMTAYATVPSPDGLAFDGRGNLYVTSPFTDTIYVVTPAGIVSPLAFSGTETLDGPSAVVFQGSSMYITNLNLASTYSSGYVSVVALHPP